MGYAAARGGLEAISAAEQLVPEGATQVRPAIAVAEFECHARRSPAARAAHV